MHYKVLTHLYIDKKQFLLCFECDAILSIGSIVEIYIRNKKYFGIIYEICNDSHDFMLKKATHLYDLNSNYIVFIRQFCEFFITNTILFINIIKSFITIRKSKISKIEMNILKNIDLNIDQQGVVNEYFTANKLITLLWGVTGCGKTEISINIAIETLKRGEQVLILVPEIALTHNMVSRFTKYFNIDICVWNSKNQNKSKFMNILNGNTKLIIGARSAILLPYKNLKLIIIDEMHDKSYVQNQGVFYDTIQTAIIRAKCENIRIFMMTATPTLRSIYMANNGDIHLIKLFKKFHENAIKVTNIQFNNTLFDNYSLQRINEEINRGNQVMIFINRRGFANTLICKICKNIQKCIKCFSNLIYHMRENYKTNILCHKCNIEQPINTCNICHSINNISAFGYGVERIYKMLQQKLNANIEIFDSDYCDSEIKIAEFIEKVNNNKINIIIGTQMLSKGHDFRKLSLVIIFMYNLHNFNYEMNENVMQNLMQISGRVGRNNIQSEVILQNFTTHKYDLSIQKYEQFIYNELIERKKWNMPPYIYIVTIYVINTKKYHEIKLEISVLFTIYENNNHEIIVHVDNIYTILQKLQSFINDIRVKIQ